LQYRVSVGVFKQKHARRSNYRQVNGDNITLSVKGGKLTVNGTAHVIASVPASNGIIHVVDAVLLPPKK
jgi:uncharacterized surface protein with fasciclin (FAS1) repeats